MNKMNNKQKGQFIVSVIFIILIICWLTIPGWGAGKILGLIGCVLGIVAMTLSYREEEKMKKTND